MSIISAKNGGMSFVIDKNGNLQSCGLNNNNTLGHSSGTYNVKVFTEVPTIDTWISIVSGGTHAIGIKIDGSLWSWGTNTFGQLGNGVSPLPAATVETPTKIDDTEWLQAACGNIFSVFLNSNGTLWAAGSGSFQGQGSAQSNSATMKQVGDDSDWVYIDATSASVFAIKENNTMWSWGINTFGQLGIGNNTGNIYGPTETIDSNGENSNWGVVSCGYYNTFAIKRNGTLWMCGNSSFKNGSSNEMHFIKIGADSDWVDVSCGSDYVIALKSDGTMYSWGKNTYGSLGLGSAYDAISYVAAPTQIGTGTNWVYVTSGNYHNIAVRDNNGVYELWSWGYNYHGQLGLNTDYSDSTVGNDTTIVNEPTLVTNVTPYPTSLRTFADPHVVPIFGSEYLLPHDENTYLLLDNNSPINRLVVKGKCWFSPKHRSTEFLNSTFKKMDIDLYNLVNWQLDNTTFYRYIKIEYQHEECIIDMTDLNTVEYTTEDDLLNHKLPIIDIDFKNIKLGEIIISDVDETMRRLSGESDKIVKRTIYVDKFEFILVSNNLTHFGNNGLTLNHRYTLAQLKEFNGALIRQKDAVVVKF